jgi:hypothetical protein
VKSVLIALAGLALISSAFAEDLYRTDEANIQPIKAQNYEIHRVTGTDSYVITDYSIQHGGILVNSRVVNAADGSGAGDRHLEVDTRDTTTSPGAHLNDIATPGGCSASCTLVDVYTHTTALGGCQSAVTVTYVWVDGSTGAVFTDSVTSTIRTPACHPGN